MRPLSLYTWQYDVERGYDFLTVVGTQFKSGSGPNGVKLSKGESLLWKSDKSKVEEGWKVCTAKRTGEVYFTNTQTHTNGHIHVHPNSH